MSDAEFVERIRGNTPARRKAGAIGLVFSLILCGFFGYWLQMATSGKWTIHDDPAEQLAFQMGAITGGGGVMALYLAIWWLAHAIFLYFPDRREQLLLEYHRRLAELNQSHDGSE